ncbi:MAG TPA: ScpA family protein, partial [Bdellovibrionota bacterium]|nr:ScpA family protein [Bdellovibrionota bacterium]
LMQEMNFEMASEFLLMAATLLYWKSKAILPREDDPNAAIEEDLGPSPEELLRRMLEHQRFLIAGDELNQLNQLDMEVFTRPYKRPKIEKIWREMGIDDLALAYQEALIQQRRKTKVLKKETVSVAETIRDFADRLDVGRPTDLRSLLGDTPTVPRVVVGFLAGLELAKLKKMRLHQNEVYDPIYLELLENIRAIRLELASDFDVTEFDRTVAADSAAAAAGAGSASGASTGGIGPGAESGTAADVGPAPGNA